METTSSPRQTTYKHPKNEKGDKKETTSSARRTSIPKTKKETKRRRPAPPGKETKWRRP